MYGRDDVRQYSTYGSRDSEVDNHFSEILAASAALRPFERDLSTKTIPINNLLLEETVSSSQSDGFQIAFSF